MSVQSTQDTYISLLGTLGKAALNSLYPNDFELYVIALDLVNSDGKSEAYFIFPVMPFTMAESHKPIQSIKKTAGGITVLNTQTFAPTDTTIQGNFGRKFKFLLGNQLINFSALTLVPPVSQPLFAQEFDPTIKTGYGCIKVLEAIYLKSNTLDSKGKPYALYFYNLASGNNYLVKITTFEKHQNQENNMIWHYNMGIKSLLPVEQVSSVSASSLTANLAANSIIQNGVNSVGNFLGSVL
jgi:hypothetical protein